MRAAVWARRLLFSLVCVACPAVTSASVVITNVTVIDVEASSASAARKPNQAIVVKGERIAWIGDQAKLPANSGATIIDGKSKFAVPGFWDMHVHIAGPQAQQRASLLLLLANGVTNVRDMGNGSTVPTFQQLQKRLQAGSEAGPRITASPINITDGPLAADAEDLADPSKSIFYPKDANGARTLVDYVRSNGIGFIKPYDRLPRESFFALMREARRRGVVVAGHNPQAISVTEAAQSGMKSLEHARALPWNCAPEGDKLQQKYELGTTGKAPPPDGLKLQNDTAFLRAVISGFDEGRCRQIARVMKRHGMYYVPTHTTRRIDAFASLSEVRDNALRRFIDPKVRDAWAEDLSFYGDSSVSDRAAYMAFYNHGLMTTRIAFEEGVKILVGTDAPDTSVYPGFSFHQEMRDLVSAGIPAFDVLRSATVIAAEYSQLQAQHGAVALGKVADMVLLDADPMTDIANSERIFLVMKAGVLYDRSRIEGLKAEAEALVSEREAELAEKARPPAQQQ